MRAIVIQRFGGLDSLVIENLPDPIPRVFQFDEIRQAHEAMESNQANGKMVIRI